MRRETFSPLDATHTQAEQNVYSVLYRLTISRGATDRRATVAELMHETGIRSDKTVRTALKGLEAKLSVTVLDRARSSNFGPLYRVHRPKEILEARRRAGIQIDEQTKRISAPVDAPVITAAPTAAEAPVGAPAEFTGAVTGPSLSHVLKNHDDDSAIRATILETLPDAPRAAVDAAVTAIGEHVAALMQRAAERAKEPVATPAFFVACVERALAGGEAREARRGARKAPAVVEASTEPARAVDPAEALATMRALRRELVDGGADEATVREALEEYAREHRLMPGAVDEVMA